MQDSPSVPWRALNAALGLGAAAAASLALAGAASAAVISVTPDGTAGTDNLGTAIATANTNTSTSNTIVIAPGTYTPADAATAQPITITKNLTVVADHTFQSPAGQTPAVEVNGSAANAKASNDLFVINSGVNVTFEGMNIDSGGAVGFATFLVNGNLTLDGVTMDGTPGNAIQTVPGGSATLNESTINADQVDAIANAGSITLNNSDITQGAANGISNQPGYHLNISNSLIAFQAGSECLGGGATNTGPAVTASIDDDGTCGVTASLGTGGVDSLFPNGDGNNGGPASSILFPSNSFTTGKGANCPTADERFFANPVVGGVRQCDVGAVTTAATQETTAPSCTVTGGSAGPPKTQQVTLADAGTGAGPEAGPSSDNLTNVLQTAYPPTAAGPVPGYSVSNAQINNGTIGFTAGLPTTGLVVTATKTNQTASTQWSFTGMNWAGVSRNCF